MDKLFFLDERLLKCASLVPDGSRLVDVGSDHAYLPVWLLKNGKIPFAIASDINEKPLESGRATAEKYGAKDIEFRLGAGLETVGEDDRLDCAVIAGMGGEVISLILEGSPLSKKLDLVLQPMTKSEELVKYLCENGFELKKQSCVFCRGKYYTVIKARFDGEKKEYKKSFLYAGRLDLSDEACRGFLKNHIKNLKNKSRGDKSLLPLIEELENML